MTCRILSGGEPCTMAAGTKHLRRTRGAFLTISPPAAPKEGTLGPSGPKAPMVFKDFPPCGAEGRHFGAFNFITFWHTRARETHFFFFGAFTRARKLFLPAALQDTNVALFTLSRAAKTVFPPPAALQNASLAFWAARIY